MNQINKLLQFDLLDIGNHKVTISKLILSVAILIATWLLLWFSRKLFKSLAKKRDIEEGRWLAFYQIFKYFAWVIAISLALDTININITVLIASSAALFVGIGLGMQSIFQDFFSGLILLFEGSVRVNDILEIDGEVIKVQKIGIRTSEVINRDDVDLIIPNSVLVSDKVVNLSHRKKRCRFIIEIGVAYGSDADKVIELLVEAAAEHKDCYQRTPPMARLANFGAYSLDFELLFWSRNTFRIRNVQSDIRRSIIRKLDAHQIQIPFPQQDIHVKRDINL